MQDLRVKILFYIHSLQLTVKKNNTGPTQTAYTVRSYFTHVQLCGHVVPPATQSTFIVFLLISVILYL